MTQRAMLLNDMSSNSMTSALYPVHEVFASIQGEGVFVGEPQIFVRLEGCPLRCAWCDTPRTWKLPDAAAMIADVERTAPKNRGQKAWVEAREIANWVEALDPGGTRTVSVTGGEPLMWPAAILELRELLPQRRLHLETAGAFPESLARVLDAVDHVSADLKLPADLGAPVPLDQAVERSFETVPANAAEWREQRRAVLSLIAERDACLKLVIAGGRAVEDFEPLLRDALELAPRLPLILQPASAIRAIAAPSEALVQGVEKLATSLGLKVRILPQVHVLLGLR